MEVPSTLIDLGIHVLGREVTDMVPKDREVYIEWEIFQQLQEIRLLKTLASRAYQRDIGSPWQLPWRLNGAPCDAVGRGDESKHLSIDLSSSRSKDESLLSPASIAQGREIEAGGATCGPISLGEKCLVGEREGEVVEGSILFLTGPDRGEDDGSKLYGGAIIHRDCVLGPALAWARMRCRGAKRTGLIGLRSSD